MSLTLTTVGVGAANSPRFRPAGLLLQSPEARIMIDGGPQSEPAGRLDAWLVSDPKSELQAEIRRAAARRGLIAGVRRFSHAPLAIRPRPVVHTNHPTFGYLVTWHGCRVVWAPEFFRFPRWAAAADLMFAECAAWDRPIRFRGAVGGHLDALSVSRMAQRLAIKRLVFAHIGRPTIAAIDRGDRPCFGSFARDGQVFRLREL